MKKTFLMMVSVVLLSGCESQQSASEQDFLGCRSHCTSIGMSMDSLESQTSGVCACEIGPDERA